jgi:hypothetical protein
VFTHAPNFAINQIQHYFTINRRALILVDKSRQRFQLFTLALKLPSNPDNRLCAFVRLYKALEPCACTANVYMPVVRPYPLIA